MSAAPTPSADKWAGALCTDSPQQTSVQVPMHTGRQANVQACLVSSLVWDLKALTQGGALPKYLSSLQLCAVVFSPTSPALPCRALPCPCLCLLSTQPRGSTVAPLCGTPLYGVTLCSLPG